MLYLDTQAQASGMRTEASDEAVFEIFAERVVLVVEGLKPNGSWLELCFNCTRTGVSLWESPC